MIERVRLRELRDLHERAGNPKLTNRELAKRVFRGEDTTASRREQLLSRWDHGHDLGALRPRHIIRLSRVFEQTDVNNLLQYTQS